MSEQLLILDGGAIESLFTSAGETGWDLLKKPGLRVVVPQIILDEMSGIPPYINGGEPNPNYGLLTKFTSWINQQGSSVVIVNYDPFPNGAPPSADPGDVAIRKLMEGADPDVIASKP